MLGFDRPGGLRKSGWGGGWRVQFIRSSKREFGGSSDGQAREWSLGRWATLGEKNALALGMGTLAKRVGTKRFGQPKARSWDSWPSFCIVKPFYHLVLHQPCIHVEASFLILMIIRVIIHEQRLWLSLWPGSWLCLFFCLFFLSSPPNLYYIWYSRKTSLIIVLYLF